MNNINNDQLINNLDNNYFNSSILNQNINLSNQNGNNSNYFKRECAKNFQLVPETIVKNQPKSPHINHGTIINNDRILYSEKFIPIYIEPKTFISENEKYIYIELELPGVKLEKIKAEFKNQILKITATKNDVYKSFDGILSQRNPKSNGIYQRILKFKIESLDDEDFDYLFQDSILFIRINKHKNTPMVNNKK